MKVRWVNHSPWGSVTRPPSAALAAGDSGMMCAGCQAQTDAALKWLHQIPAPGGAFSEKKQNKTPFHHSREQRFKLQTTQALALRLISMPRVNMRDQ